MIHMDSSVLPSTEIHNNFIYFSYPLFKICYCNTIKAIYLTIIITSEVPFNNYVWFCSNIRLIVHSNTCPLIISNFQTMLQFVISHDIQVHSIHYTKHFQKSLFYNLNIINLTKTENIS